MVQGHALGKKAEVASKYLTKGTQVYIEGRLRVEEWTDREGKNRHTLEVQGTDMQFLGGGGRSDDYAEGESSREAEFAGPADSPATEFAPPAKADDDIPF